ncbi:MAG TPA: serine/threonine-protein kinase [Kribbellaceae bacterium]|nr:serine/threonine-protein kinase [Kribbellaceae bacterium]
MGVRLLAGRYRLLQPLGQGGMGVVWRSRDELLGRDVAVKEVLIPPELSHGERETLRERTLREARSAARLSHPNVVTIFDVVEEAGRPWIVMEFVASRSLAEVLREDGPLPPRQVAEVGRQVLAALRVAHAAGVLHRDVKPSNVLLGRDGRVVLTDFGIATLEGDPSLTTSGMLLGSPAFIAPERVQARGTGPESDLWSLGATLYTAVEGRPPYDRGAPLPTLAAVVTETADPPRLAGPAWPVIERLLRKDPAERIGAEEADRLLRNLASASDQAEQVPHAWQRPAAPPPTVAAHDGEGGDGERTSLLPIYPAGLVRTVREPGRRLTLRPVAIAVALLAAVGFGWGTLRWSENGDRGDGQPAADTTRSGQPSASRPPRSTAPSATQSRPPSQPPSPPSTGPTVGSATLPAGFERYRDRTGFSLAVPAGWNITRQSGRVYFREPEGSRLLIIDQTDDPKPDPVADWEQQEQARRDGYPDYRRIHIGPVDYFQSAADWEFTYAGRHGRVHVLIRGTVTSPRQAYGIYWSTADGRWQDSLRYWRTFTETFRPGT